MLLRFRMLHPGLTLDDFGDVLDRELQLGESIIHSVSSEWVLLSVLEQMFPKSALLATRVIDGEAFVIWLWSLFVIAMVERRVGRAFHCFLHLNVRLGSVQDLTPTSDIVLHQMFVQRVGDSQSANECAGDIFTAVVHLGQLILEVVDKHLETVRRSHLDGKEVVIVLLKLLAVWVL